MSAGVAPIRRTLEHLRRQTALSQIDVIVLCPLGLGGQIGAKDFEGFPSARVHEVANATYNADLWAAGIRAARSPYAVLCEDHSYPDPAWAAGIIHAFEDRQTAVVAVLVRNANPQTAVSRASYLLCFGEFMPPRNSGPIEYGPGHNCAYRIVALGFCRDRLETALLSERLLHSELQARGETIALAAGATTAHVNLSLPRSYLRHSFYGGRLFGGERRKTWSPVRRLAQAAAFLLVPPLRLKRLLAATDAAKRKELKFIQTLPCILLGLLLHASGEAAGYLLGTGDALDRYQSFESYRAEHVTDGEKSLLLI